jgi:hypothetical protein
MRAYMSEPNPRPVVTDGPESWETRLAALSAELEARAILAEAERTMRHVYNGPGALRLCGEPVWAADGKDARAAARALAAALAAVLPVLDELEAQARQ